MHQILRPSSLVVNGFAEKLYKNITFILDLLIHRRKKFPLSIGSLFIPIKHFTTRTLLLLMNRVRETTAAANQPRSLDEREVQGPRTAVLFGFAFNSFSIWKFLRQVLEGIAFHWMGWKSHFEVESKHKRMTNLHNLFGWPSFSRLLLSSYKINIAYWRNSPLCLWG